MPVVDSVDFHLPLLHAQTVESQAVHCFKHIKSHYWGWGLSVLPLYHVAPLVQSIGMNCHSDVFQCLFYPSNHIPSTLIWEIIIVGVIFSILVPNFITMLIQNWSCPSLHREYATPEVALCVFTFNKPVIMLHCCDQIIKM